MTNDSSQRVESQLQMVDKKGGTLAESQLREQLNRSAMDRISIPNIKRELLMPSSNILASLHLG